MSAAANLYDLPVNRIHGEPASLADFRGKVLLIVNVASKCGLTPQYEGLEKLRNTFQPRGFEILGFPANDFAGQEPGSNQEIQKFCSLTYGVSFPSLKRSPSPAPKPTRSTSSSPQPSPPPQSTTPASAPSSTASSPPPEPTPTPIPASSGTSKSSSSTAAATSSPASPPTCSRRSPHHPSHPGRTLASPRARLTCHALSWPRRKSSPLASCPASISASAPAPHPSSAVVAAVRPLEIPGPPPGLSCNPTRIPHEVSHPR